MRTVIDTPGDALVSLDQMSVGRDGTGALVYTKDVGGVAHVFVSRLLGGSFQTPQQVDAGLPGPSSQPVIAADGGGLLLVAFVNAGQLDVAQAPSLAAPVGPPAALAGAAADPSLSISPSGKAYLAFTSTAAGHAEVDYAFWDGQWSAPVGPVDVSGSLSAGAGGDRPQVAACGDGIGIVTWGEGGHVYARRLIATTPSVQTLQADPPSVGSFGEVSASDPVVSCVGLSTYAAVAFTEQTASGELTQERVVYNRLHGEQFDGAQIADGANTGGAEGASQPQAAVTEFGPGYVTSQLTTSHQLDALELGGSSRPAGVLRVDSLPNGTAPDAAPAAAGLYSLFVAWQQTPGSQGPAEIRLRYAPDGSDLGPEQVVSDPALGPTNADLGLVDGGDVAGDAAVAWVQGSGASTAIVAAQLYQPPGSFAPGWATRYYASAYPTLSWSVPAEPWGPLTYTVTFDGRPIAATGLTTVRPGPIADGRHVWQVSATNRAGVTVTARSASVFVDTVLPRASLSLTGRRQVGRRLKLVISSIDPPPPGQPTSAASGIARIVVRWGDRGVRIATRRRFTATHVYRRARTYRVMVTAYDRAGNRTTITRTITIAPTNEAARRRQARQERAAVARLARERSIASRGRRRG